MNYVRQKGEEGGVGLEILTHSYKGKGRYLMEGFIDTFPSTILSVFCSLPTLELIKDPLEFIYQILQGKGCEKPGNLFYVIYEQPLVYFIFFLFKSFYHIISK